MFGFWLRGELAAGPRTISEVIAPAAGYADTMHSEAEDSKEGMILISLAGPAKFCGGMWRQGVAGEPRGVLK